MREAAKWNKATRKRGGGGIHIYIPQEQIERALCHANLDPKEMELQASAVGMGTAWSGRARILVTLRRAPDEQGGRP